jgi:alkylated DNA repair dioxygenase AlkB
MQPRLTAWYGDISKPYTYSGLTMQANHWIKSLLSIKSVADKYAGIVSSSALLNLYRDGHDGLGWHRDNEKVLGPEPVIASVSLGTVRSFQLRPYKKREPLISLDLEPGSLVIMRGETQRMWEHRIPKTSMTKGARINITFRSVVG